MDSIIRSTLKTLEKSKTLLTILSDDQLSDDSVAPYYSSIGSHIRHIYDFYDCSLSVDSLGKVDLTARKRIAGIANCCDFAIDHLEGLKKRISKLSISDYDKIVVIDDLGDGKIEIDYTFQAILTQANSHAIHHYAIINYILDRLNITISDSDFGYNATTPKQILN